MQDRLTNPNATRKWATCLGVALCLLAGLVAYQGAIWAQRAYRDQAAAEADPLAIVENELSLGSVRESGKHEHILRVLNRSAKPVIIRAIDATCDCLGIVPNRDVKVAAGDSVQIGLTLKAVIPTGQRSDKGYLFTVPIRIRYSVGEGDENRDKEWILTANITPVITVPRTPIDFGSQSVFATVPERAIEVEAERFVKDVRCRISSSWKTRVERISEAGGKSRFRITISPAEPLVPHRLADVLTVTPVGEQEALLPAKEVRLVGELLPDLVATPGGVHVGRREIGVTVTEYVRVHSLTNRAFVVAKVEADEGLSVTAGESQDLYRLELRVSRPGEQAGKIAFHVQDANRGRHVVKVEVRYVGASK